MGALSIPATPVFTLELKMVISLLLTPLTDLPSSCK